MGLLIYETPVPGSQFSASGVYTNPLVQIFDGVTGNTVDRRYYVRNSDATRSYSGISLQPSLLTGNNIFDGTSGFVWKLIVGDTQPLEEQWRFVAAGNSVVIPNIGTALASDIATFEPFWLRMTVPRGASIKSYAGIALNIAGTEILIP